MPTNRYDTIRRLLEQPRAPKPPKSSYAAFPTAPSFGELSIFEKAIDLISRPTFAVSSFADASLKGQNPFMEAIKGFAGVRRTTMSDVLKTAGMQPGLARSALGFAGDVLADPLTYVGVGPVKAAGQLTVKGIPRALSAAGVATKEAAIGAKTVQSARVLAHPRMTPSRLEGLRKGLPAEAGVLTREMAPETFKAGPGASALGTKYGRDATSRLIGIETRPGALKGAPALPPRTQTAMRRHLDPAVKPPVAQGLLPSQKALLAPKAIKFMGQAIPGTERALAGLAKARPVGRALDAVQKLPWVGKVVAPTRELFSKAGGAAKAIFSGKTGDAEFDFKRTMMRDLLHRMNLDTQKAMSEIYKEATDIVGGDALKRKAMNREWVRMMEGVWEDFVKLEPHPRDSAIRKRIFDFKTKINELTGMQKAAELKAAPARAAVQAAKADVEAIPGQVVQDLPKFEREIKTEATANAIKEAEESLRIAQTPGGGDALSLLDVDGTKVSLSKEWLAKTGSTKGAELRDAIGSKYLAAPGTPGQGLDELAARLGVDTDEEAADLLIKAGLKRREYREAIAKLKGTKKELKGAGLPRPLPEAPPRAPDTVRVHHGGPNEIKGEFSLEHVGTGEGAAAYGHGGYFAESKSVGQHYQKTLSGGKSLTTDELKEYFKPGQIVHGYTGMDRVVAFHEKGNPITGGWYVQVESVPSPGRPAAKRWHSTMPAAQEFEDILGRPAESLKGKLYHLDIHETDKYLDWDKPLSEQAASVQKALKGINNIFNPFQRGESIYAVVTKIYGSKKAASEKLKSLGIPGIKYFDATSRAAGKGSRNFVVFDERLIKKLHDEAVEGMPIKVPAEDIPTHLPAQGVEDIRVPEEHLAAASERKFGAEVEKRTADALKRVKDLEAALAKTGGEKRRAILQKQIDLAKADVGVWESKLANLKPQEVRYRRKAAFTPADPRVEELGKKLRARLEMVFKGESKVNPLLRHREFYLPHVMTEDVRGVLIQIIKQDPKKVLKTSEFSTTTAHAMARSTEKNIDEMRLQDLIEKGDVDPSKVRKYFESIGRPMSAVDELIFETDPVKAAMGRELAHNRAVVAGQFTDEILNSSTFVKARVNAEDLLKLRQWRGEMRAGIKTKETDIPLIQKILDEHEDHAIFIPAADYQRTFLTKEAQDAARQGAGSGADMIPLLKEILEGDYDKLTGALARSADQGKPIRAYVIPKSIAEHLSKAHRLMLDDQRVGDFLKVFDKWQGWWKTFATVVRPAFHVRNAVSNLWQNFLAGVTSPKAYYLAGGLQNEAMRKAMAKIGKYDPQQVYDLAIELGVLKTGFVGGDIGEFLERTVNPSKNWLSTSGPLARFGQKRGTEIEDNARLANFVDGLLKGMDPESASMRVKKYLFDYGDLSEVEKSVFRRIAPFYTFTRKSIPLAIESLLTQPGKVSVLGKARMEAEKHFESLDREYVADYINKAFGIPVHKNAKGEFEYFLLKGYIPTVDIAKLDHQEILGMLSPFIKAPIEQALNVDFYRMKPISRFPTEMVEFMGVPMPVRMAHFMRNLVLMAQLDREIFREGAGFGKGIASELSFRVQTQNPVDQMRRYVLASQVEMGEIKRLMETAKARGENYKAAQYEQRLALLVARRDEAKEKTLKLDPDAFKFRKPGEQKKPKEMPDFNQLRRQMQREASVDALLKKKAR